ncbi:DUF1684 domain-containing protein [Acidipropionibacterium virtanenii]|uniref:DUF1684 domain-containing protein n=1 Tax=Acidipropionibacterium virtanenii TaxID=2057246 RepID=A0A344UW50_9ACTN|nr:DUF1684 domain-containing protein [Acidipropionibacterium virtanenii]AXE39498.1 hypothetical protein JS278_02357 [Acidipropionibacterium virtanenii]
MSQTAQDTQFAAEWKSWHDAHEAARTDPLGILAATGLYFLDDDPLSVPGVPGSWQLVDGQPQVALPDGQTLTDGGRTLTGTVGLGERIADGGVLLGYTDGRAHGAAEVAWRGSQVMLRPRRDDGAYLAHFPGTPAYPADPAWVVPARFEAFDQARDETVGAVIDGLEHHYTAPGVLTFSVGGTEYRLTAFKGGRDGSLMVLMRDATSGVTTYGASRTLSVPAPDAEGNTVIDFNRASNLPCAYTNYATCPLPPAENRLPIAVEAGEKLPLSRVD